MVEKVRSRLFRAVSISILLLVTLSFFSLLQLRIAHADASRNTIFFDTTGSHTITVQTTNSGGTISYSIVDYANNQIGSGGPLNVSNGQVDVPLPAQDNGYYTLNVTDNTVNPARNIRLGYAIIPSFTRPSDSPFGINTHIPGVTGSALLAAVQGDNWARLDIEWKDVEKVPGQFNFDKYDPFMQELAQNTIKPFVILDYANPLYGGGKTPGGNEVDAHFADYVVAVLRHYGSQIQAVEVYNEYNIMNTACGQPNVNCYRELLQTAYQAVKSVDSNVVVVAGATAGNDGAWFEDLFKLGGMQYADAFSYHFYAGPESNNG